MRGLLSFSILGIVMLMNAGCGGPTPYQKADKQSSLGYSDYRVKDNIYHVTFSGAPVNDKAVYREYWNRRSKELCEAMGFQDYRVIDYKQDDGDATPIEKAAPSTPYDRMDPRYRSSQSEVVKDYSRAASASGEVECLKKSK